MDREEVIVSIIQEIREEGILPFKGCIPPRLSMATSQALFFKTTCDCGVTAMLSVDIPKDASDDRVQDMIPHLADALDSQARQFKKMPCQSHSRMLMK